MVGRASHFAQDACLGKSLLHQSVKEGAGLLYVWGGGGERMTGRTQLCSSVRNGETGLQIGTRMR